MGLITGIVPQEAFPRQDISAANAAVLALMLANADFLGLGHERAESMARLYQMGHAAMRIAGQHLPESDQSSALDHGITIYEAMAALVRPASLPGGNVIAVSQNAGAIQVMPSGELFDLLGQAEAAFRNETPNTRVVVSEAAERFYPHQIHYAVCGAALARQFELAVNS
jgi:hypothetical protein